MGDAHRHAIQPPSQHSPADIEHRVRMNHVIVIGADKLFQLPQITAVAFGWLRKMKHPTSACRQLRLIGTRFAAKDDVMNGVFLRICIKTDIRCDLFRTADAKRTRNNQDAGRFFRSIFHHPAL